MNMNEIIERHETLTRKLNLALATMERKSVIYELRKELLDLQGVCPHFSAEHNFAIIDEHCPYCGKNFGGR